jgi:lactose/L-arabinose transport system substrate-binding protein
MEEAGKYYNSLHPNVTVNVVETSQLDIQAKFNTAFASGQTSTLPDIVCAEDYLTMKNLVTFPGKFLPYDGKIDLSQFLDFKVQTGTYNGNHYSLPLDNGVAGQFVRKDIVEQAGFQVSDFDDLTWEQYIEKGRIVKQKTGITMLSTEDYAIIELMVRSTGNWYFDAQGKVNIRNNPVFKRIFELIKEMVDAGVLMRTPSWDAYVATVNNGSVAGVVNGCWMIGIINQEPSQSGKWRLIKPPRLSSFNSVNYSNVGGSNWMVLANTKYPDTAFDFLKTCYAEVNSPIHKVFQGVGYLTCFIPAAGLSFNNDPFPFFDGQRLYTDLSGYAKSVPVINYGAYTAEAREACTSALQEYLNGTSVETALNSAHRKVEFLTQ